MILRRSDSSGLLRKTRLEYEVRSVMSMVLSRILLLSIDVTESAEE